MRELPVAVITGGEGALGSAMHRTFTEQGYRIASFDVADRSSGTNEPVDDEKTLHVLVDVSSGDAVIEAIAQVTEAFGRIDVLVNNAGIANITETASLAVQDWHSVIETHLTGTFLCSRAAYPSLRRSNRAAIINMSSVVAHLGLPQRAAYSAAKAGIEGLTRCLAAEWARDNIRVNALAPGYIRTPHQDAMFARGVLSESRIQQRTLLGDLGLPSDIAVVAAFLASPDARFITGQTLLVDGGFSIDAGIDHPPHTPATSNSALEGSDAD